jgi:cytochrome P450
MLAFRRDALGFLCQVSRTYGDIASFRLGPERAVLLSHPEDIRHVLVTHHRGFIKGRRGNVAKQFLGEGLLNSEGEVHHRQRRLTQPAFHHQRLTQYATVMTTDAARMSQNWRDGDRLDVALAMQRLTLTITGKTLFGADMEAEAQDIGNAITTLLHLSPRFALPFAAWLTKLPLPSMVRLRQAQRYLDQTIYRIIDVRRAHGDDTGDLLSILLLTSDETNGGVGMSDKQVHDEALTLLLAGHETTALALTWTWYLLSQYPEVETVLHRELAQVLAGREPTVADLPRLPYVRQVFSEALRLYPPAWMMTRRTVHDYTIGRYTLPAGTFIVISPYVTHHDPRFFPDPEVFCPERWTPPHDDTRPRFAFFPFGGGPRQCIGEGFAWMEGMLLLAMLAQQWRLQGVPDHPVVPQPLVTLRPKHGLPMRLVRR